MQNKQTTMPKTVSSAHKSGSLSKIKKELLSYVGKNWEESLSALKLKYPAERALNDPAKYLDIATNCLVKQNKIYVRNQYKEQIALEDCSFSFFVDPHSKILTKNKFYEDRQKQRALEKAKKIEQASVFRKIINESFIAIKQPDEKWSILRVSKIEKPEFDAYLKRTVNPAFDRSMLFDTYGVKDVFCEETRILTYQETRQLNLI